MRPKERKSHDHASTHHHSLDPVRAGWRLVPHPAHEGKGGQVKHASEIFPPALAELFKLAEQGKARNPRTTETRKGDRVVGDRETIRVVRKRARQMTLQFNTK